MAVSNVKLFNNVMDAFLMELIEIFPEEIKIKIEYSLFQTLSAVNCKKIPMDFMKTTIPFLEKICMKDSSFFTGPDRPEFLNRLNIMSIWSDDLSPVTKDSIWRYIALFLSIGSKIVDVSDESKVIIDYIIFNS